MPIETRFCAGMKRIVKIEDGECLDFDPFPTCETTFPCSICCQTKGAVGRTRRLSAHEVLEHEISKADLLGTPPVP